MTHEDVIAGQLDEWKGRLRVLPLPRIVVVGPSVMTWFREYFASNDRPWEPPSPLQVPVLVNYAFARDAWALYNADGELAETGEVRWP